MREITMKRHTERSFLEVFQMFETSQAAKGVADVTLKNYKYHLSNISHYFNVNNCFEEITKREIEEMIVAMRKKGLAHNTIATYVRLLKTFYNWCEREGLYSINITNIKEKETVKETYSDEELELLLKRPDRHCDFGEFRSWVIVNFLMNCGCRASTIRNIKNKDVDFDAMQVVFRHNKNGRIQSIPLCSRMASVLREYMKVRGGERDDYLFCDVYGGELTEDALRHAIARYNKSRGVKSKSIHKFRHTFARKYLIDCGGNAFTLQRLLGHSTLNMTKHYCRIFDSDIAKDYDLHSPLALMHRTEQRIKRK